MKYDNVHIGTSGFHYEHWVGPFYPEGVKQKDFLTFYTRYFQTVELNNTFYQLPREAAVRHWRELVPEGFIFAVKASRYITHVKKLSEPQEALKLFFERVELFEETVGPILFQLPPSWHVNTERLGAFLKMLPKDYSYAFEFRNPTWFNEEVYKLLERRGCALCVYDSGGQSTPDVITADLMYMRLHGPGTMYAGDYPVDLLEHYAEVIKHWARKVKDVYIYFNNDIKGYAVQNGLRLRELITHKAAVPV